MREGDAMARRRAGEDNDDGASEDNDDGGQFDEAILWLGSDEGVNAARGHCRRSRSTIEPDDVCHRLVLNLLEKRLTNPGFLGKDHKISNLPAYLNRALRHELVKMYRELINIHRGPDADASE